MTRIRGLELVVTVLVTTLLVAGTVAAVPILGGDVVRDRTASAPASLSLSNETVARGALLRYTIDGMSANDAVHVVAIDARRLTRPLSGPTEVGGLARLFLQREYGTLQRGVVLDDGTVLLENGMKFDESGNLVTSSASTTVEGQNVVKVFATGRANENGTRAGNVDTGRLDSGETGITVFDGGESVESAVSSYAQTWTTEGADFESFLIEANPESLRITRPADTYVIGSEIEVAGTAHSEMDDVAVYVRSTGNWKLVPALSSVPVTSEGTWDTRPVNLGVENEYLSVPQQVQIGVIPVHDADLDFDGEADTELSRQEFNNGEHSSHRIAVSQQSLTATFRTFGGEVAIEDSEISIVGAAESSKAAIIVVTDDGSVFGTTATVQGSTFNEKLELGDRGLGRSRVTGLVFSPGGNGVFGEPGSDPDSADELVSFAIGLNERNLARQQVIDLLMDKTVGYAATDDNVTRQRFRITRAKTRIEDTAPAIQPDMPDMPVQRGEQVLVRGVTNRNTDHTIRVRVINGPSRRTVDAFRLAEASEWNRSGRWQVRFTIPSNAAPGTYRVQANDGIGTSTGEFEVVSRLEANVTISNQTASEGRSVTVEEAYLARGGYVVVHAGTIGGRLIGQSEFLEPGRHENVQITFEEPLAESTTVVAVPHLGSRTERATWYRSGTGVSGIVSDSARVTVEVAAEPTATGTVTPTETTTEMSTPTATATATQSPTDQGGPGFGIVVALFALVATLVAIHRFR